MQGTLDSTMIRTSLAKEKKDKIIIASDPKTFNFYKKQFNSPVNAIESQTTQHTTMFQSKNTSITIDNISKGSVIISSKQN